MYADDSEFPFTDTAMKMTQMSAPWLEYSRHCQTLVTADCSQWALRVGPSRNRTIKKLRLHILSLLSIEAKKLRLPQAQTKELVKKLRLRLLPYDAAS